MNKYRKKPVVIDAVRFHGSTAQMIALKMWIDGEVEVYREPDVVTRDLRSFQIETLEGAMTVEPGDWVIKGVAGEFYPCKPLIFTMTYEPASQS